MYLLMFALVLSLENPEDNFFMWLFQKAPKPLVAE